MNNKNGLRVALWLAGIIVTLVLFIGFPTLVSGVIMNDKESRSRDTRIESESRDRDTKIKEDFQKEVKEINTSQHNVEKALVAIKVKMGIPVDE